MAKTLKELFEVYRPKAKDEQDFVDKHITVKHKDRNGNKDDVFKGNTKYIKRKKERHGYDAGDDEKVYEDIEISEEAFNELISEGQVGYKHYTITSGPKMRGMGEGGVSHIPGNTKKTASLGISTTQGKDYDTTRRITVKNRTTGEVTHHHVYQSDWSKDNSKPTLSVRHLGAATKNHAEHDNALKHYLQGKTKIKPLSEEVELDEAQRAITRGRLLDNTIGADAVKKKGDGAHRIARGFFYRSGSTSESHAQRISKELDKSGIKHTVVDHGTVDHRPFKGGASTWTQNHHWVDVKIHDKKMEVDEEFDSVRDSEEIFEELLSLGITSEEVFTEAVMGTFSVMNQARLVENTELTEELTPIKRTLALKEATKKQLDLQEKVDELVGKELEEGVSVTKNQYKWGKMITVHDGSHQSFPLHPEHQDKIRGLSKGDKTSFKDETGKLISAERTGNLVHLKQDGSNRTAAVGYHHFKEEVDQELIDELSKSKLTSYRNKAVASVDSLENKAADEKSVGIRKKLMKKADQRSNIVSNMKEDIEEIDELSRKTLGSYANKALDDVDRHVESGKRIAAVAGDSARSGDREAAKHYGDMAADNYRKAANRSAGARQAIKKMTKEDVVNNAVTRFAPAIEEQLPIEEQLIDRLGDLSESHAVTLLEMFNELNEDNQMTMLETAGTPEGVRQLLNFAIESTRGSE